MTRKYQVVAYVPGDIYEAMKKYLEDLEKQNPGLEANMSRYILSLIKEDLIRKGYLKE
jgi:predicted RNA-binding protein